MSWRVEDLPPMLQELVDVIGLDAAKGLVEAYGGTRIVVPLKMHEEHALAGLLGYDTACRLADHYALNRLDIPKADAAIRAVRDEQMRQDHRDGLSARRLALRYRLTERRVWCILAQAPGDDRQSDLFGNE